MYKYNLDYMKKDGYTERRAKEFLKRQSDEIKRGIYSEDIIEKAKECGFFPTHLYRYTKNGSTTIDPTIYLNDYDYDKLWPLNDWMRIWVNDKMTIKYMLSNTEFEEIMPKYYYYISEEGLRALIDNDNKNQTPEDFISTLKQVGSFACKPSNGQDAVGFFKLSYDNGSYYVNDEVVTKDYIIDSILNKTNYVFTEYLKPEDSLVGVSPKIHTIRIMILNRHGNNPIVLPCCYIRFWNSSVGEANFIAEADKTDDNYMICAGVNTDTGYFSGAKAFYLNKTVDIMNHPDTNVKLNGQIPNWDLLCSKAIGISKRLFGAEWIGLDMCVDENRRPRLMEINTQPGIGYLQVFRPLLSIPEVCDYIAYKLDKIKEMNNDDIIERNRIIR